MRMLVLSCSRARALVVAGLTAAHLSASAPVLAQSDEDLKAARALFQDAYKDEQEHRLADALGKFRRVAKVKDSAGVRYRIGAVLESMGRLREARDTFRALAAEKAAFAKDQAVTEGAAERASDLDKRIPRLTLEVPHPPPNTRVTLDGEVVPPTSIGHAIDVDPGEHVVRATGDGARPFSSTVKVESGSVSLGVTLEGEGASGSDSSTSPASRGGGESHTLSYVLLGGGGALLVTGIALLVVRQDDVDAINNACGSAAACPSNQRDTLTHDHDQAQVFGPLGAGLAVMGVGAVALGAYLLFRPGHALSAVRKAKATSPVRAFAVPLEGGAAIGVGGAF